MGHPSTALSPTRDLRADFYQVSAVFGGLKVGGWWLEVGRLSYQVSAVSGGLEVGGCLSPGGRRWQIPNESLQEGSVEKMIQTLGLNMRFEYVPHLLDARLVLCSG